MMESDRPIGLSGPHRSVIEKLQKVAKTDAEIFITGPSGVGKEVFAIFVHNQSERKRFNFVPVNCGSLSGDLMENVLFGHVGGAFTGAKPQSEGLVSEAEGGTLFLDEVDALSMPCQIKMLRFLQDKKYRRLGENRLRHADVRIISATNVDLESAVRKACFRKDLFFRLRVVPVDIPALQGRIDDILELISTFTEKSARKYNLPAVAFSDAAMECLKAYSWPGNIRELQNCIECLTCLQLQRPIQPADLPLLKLGEPVDSDDRACDALWDDTFSSEPEAATVLHPDLLQNAKSRLVARFEKQYVIDVLRSTNGNISAAARLSGKNRRALFGLIRKYDIDTDAYRVARPQTMPNRR